MDLRLVPIVGVSVLIFAGSAAARNTEHYYEVSKAVESALGKERLLNVPFYFAGQQHPGTKKTFGVWSANRSTRGVFRTDAEACKVAFLSALIALQQRAEKEGGEAIVEIRSVTRDKKTTSATQYRCVAGATVAHVALEGAVVDLD
jgi:hypothetical protein